MKRLRFAALDAAAKLNKEYSFDYPSALRFSGVGIAETILEALGNKDDTHWIDDKEDEGHKWYHLEKFGYDRQYIIDFIDGIAGKTGDSVGIQDGHWVREIVQLTKVGKELFSKKSMPPIVSFPDQWIKPGEYSFCPKCFSHNSLRELRDEKLVCPICQHGTRMLWKDIFKDVPFLSWRGLKLRFRHYRRYLLFKWYREHEKEVRQICEEQETYKNNANRLHQERIALAEYRRKELRLPAVFWMKEEYKDI